jgi:hypothetical protein
MIRTKYWIKDGMAVAHIENLSQKLFVEKVHKENNKVLGVEVHWWTERKLMTHTFHTDELLPWEVVLQGPEEVRNWISSEKCSSES